MKSYRDVFFEYAWAFIVILFLIGILVYLGILTPSHAPYTFIRADVELRDFSCAEMDYGFKFNQDFLKSYETWDNGIFNNETTQYYTKNDIINEINKRCLNTTRINITIGDFENE